MLAAGSWCFVSKVWGAWPQILRCAHCRPHCQSGEWHFIVTANTGTAVHKTRVVMMSVWMAPKMAGIFHNIDTSPAAFPKVLYTLRKCSTLFHPQWSSLSLSSQPWPKKICPPSELLTRSTKCSFALRTSTGTNWDISHTNFKLTKGPCHRLVLWTRSTWWTRDKQERMIWIQLICIYI